MKEIHELTLIVRKTYIRENNQKIQLINIWFEYSRFFDYFIISLAKNTSKVLPLFI